MGRRPRCSYRCRWLALAWHSDPRPGRAAGPAKAHRGSRAGVRQARAKGLLSSQLFRAASLSFTPPQARLYPAPGSSPFFRRRSQQWLAFHSSPSLLPPWYLLASRRRRSPAMVASCTFGTMLPVPVLVVRPVPVPVARQPRPVPKLLKPVPKLPRPVPVPRTVQRIPPQLPLVVQRIPPHPPLALRVGPPSLQGLSRSRRESHAGPTA
ncbi:uncharacterized protein B0H18DRAFT_27656 [Fomitopsis serialis]|uniref:uncharacterized protein n=1 Tax=Fomitopsis serialis TaxID=139415 RepID=UPI002008992B|nr:uncharacterized protein B0H18DRAFT_27656 [Neoantrodia serialis]KAH9932507.1 hypothetical protein B0H18DRAFT_27656 [Neoantrodia serialis]